MSYQVLARKWRPQTFADVVGQDHVVRALANAVRSERLHHAYLFSGTRGVGKTTIARVFAKALNCETGVTAEPCGTCESCLAISEGRFVDLIEVDAASRTRVEDTRELLENVQYAPTRGRFKVYLIDEVHMLSGHSFNALLKTLEEPPEHVKFLLATTDPQKLPVTILSRCLQFNLRHIADETIVKQLQTVTEQEKVETEAGALQQLAQGAHGSMRDALSLLDQAIAFSDGKIEVTSVAQMMGTVPKEYTEKLVQSICQRDMEAVLEIVNQLASLTIDFNKLLEQLVSLLHAAAISQAVSSHAEQMDDMQSLVELMANTLSAEDIQLYYQIALNARRDSPMASSPRAGFEMALLRMLMFTPGGVSGEKHEKRVRSPKKKLTQAPVPNEAQTAAVKPRAEMESSASPLTSEIQREPEKVELEKPANSPPISLDTKDWQEIISFVKPVGMAYALATHCGLKSREGDDFYLTLAHEHESILTQQAQAKLLEALQEKFGNKVGLEIEVGEHISETPAQKVIREQQEAKQRAAQDIMNDQFVQALQNDFSAEVIQDSIQPTDQQKESI